MCSVFPLTKVREDANPFGDSVTFENLSKSKRQRLESDEILKKSYKELIVALLESEVTKERLEEIKEDFREVIASRRAYSTIHELVDLIDILERRDHVGVDKISPLVDIAKKLGENRRFGSLLTFYTKRLQYNKHYKTIEKSDVDAPIFVNLIPESEITLPISVVDYIASNLQGSWKRFARELENTIPESFINDIDTRYRTTEEKAKEVIQLYVKQARILRLTAPYGTLLNAFENIGRRDMKEAVTGLLQRNK